MSSSNQSEVLDNIKHLQDMEEDLYNQLQEQSAAEESDQKQQKTVDTINTLSKIRKSMFKQVTDMNSNLLSKVAKARSGVVDKMTVSGIINAELDGAKSNLDALNNARNSKMRMVQINTYYGKQYRAHTGIIQLLLFTCIPLLILAFLRKKGRIPANVSNILIVIIALIGGVIIFNQVSDLSRRNNMNYDEYDWPKMSSSGNLDDYVPQPAAVGDESNDMGDSEDCVGEKCCSEGMKYDPDTKTCVLTQHTDGKRSYEKHNYLRYHHHREGEDDVESFATHGNVVPFSKSANYYPNV
tara:strand:+ start:63 stop:953 length:891 start_codon:yes stop_codon:yes gene_type:complete